MHINYSLGRRRERCLIKTSASRALVKPYKANLTSITVIIAVSTLGCHAGTQNACDDNSLSMQAAEARQEYCYRKANCSSEPIVRLDRDYSLGSLIANNEHQLTRAGELAEINAKWRYKYIDEQLETGHEVKIIDESLDQRLANSLYTAISIKSVVSDFFRVNSGNSRQDEHNLRSLEGPQVNGEQCHWQLDNMALLLRELEAKLEQRRQNASFRLGLDERHIRLARTMDSYGRYESGLLLGKYISSGSFGECKTSRLLLPPLSTDKDIPNDLVKMRFCWARLDLSKHLSASLKARQADTYEAQEHVLQMGVCLPESCHSRSFRVLADEDEEEQEKKKENRHLLQKLIDSQFKLPKSMFIDESLELDTVYCLADEQSQYGIPFAGKLLLCFISSWILVAVYATYYQEVRCKLHKKNNSNEGVTVSTSFIDSNKWALALIDCLNLKKSLQDFLGEKYDDDKLLRSAISGEEHAKSAGQQQQQRQKVIDFNILNPIKVFSMIIVVLAHAFVAIQMPNMDGLSAYNQMERDPVIFGTIAGTLIVDTFFVMTGIFMGHSAMVKFSRKAPSLNQGEQDARRLQEAISSGDCANKSSTTMNREAFAKLFVKQWFRSIMARFLRFVPMLFLVYWFKRSVFIYSFAYGQPFMDNGLDKNTLFGACKLESWSTPFTMMTAFLPLSQQCLPQTWSVAVDLFFSITVTPIALVMTRRPKLALLLGLAACLMGNLFAISAHFSVPAHKASELVQARYHGFSLMFGSLSYLYTYPHFRFSSCLAGVLAGYLIFKYESSVEQKSRQWPQWMRGWATQLSLTFMVVNFILICMTYELKPYTKGYENVSSIHMLTTCRAFWSLANAIVFVRMVTDWRRNSFLMRLLANKLWATMVKLNYVILLVHMDVLYYLLASASDTSIYSKQNIFNLFGAAYTISVPLAAILYIVFDNPIYKIYKRHVLP